MAGFTKLISPRLKVLRRAMEDDRAGTLDAFWKEIKEGGEPLLEPIEGDDQNLYATFLWRAEENHPAIWIYLGYIFCSRVYLLCLRQIWKTDYFISSPMWEKD